MGWLGCPLCCRQDFPSVEGLRDHLLYNTYRPLQCVVCNVRLAGIHQFTHHLQEHISDGVLGLHRNTPSESDTPRPTPPHQSSHPLSNTSDPTLQKTDPAYQISSQHSLTPESSSHRSTQACQTSSPLSHASSFSLYKDGQGCQKSASHSHGSDPAPHKTDSVCQTSDPLSQTPNLHKTGPTSRVSSTVLHSQHSHPQITGPCLHKSVTFSQISDHGGHLEADGVPSTLLSSAGPSIANSHLPVTDLQSSGSTSHHNTYPCHSSDSTPYLLNTTDPHSSGFTPHLPSTDPNHSSGSTSRLPKTDSHFSSSTTSHKTTIPPSDLPDLTDVTSGSTHLNTSFTSQLATSTAPQMISQDTHKPTAKSHLAVPAIIDTTSGGEDEGESRRGNASYGNNRVQGSTEMILCAYCCETCGKKVVGKDAYILHIRMHSQEQEKQSQSQDIQELHTQFTPNPQPHSQCIQNNLYPVPHSQYTLDSPHSQYTTTPETPNAQVHSKFTRISDTPHPPPHSENASSTLDGPHPQYSTDSPHLLSHSEYAGTFDTLHPHPHSHYTGTHDSPQQQLHSQYTTNSPCRDLQFTPSSPLPQVSSPADQNDAQRSPLISAASTSGNVTKDTKTVNESANLHECLSGSRDESDAGNQLLKLREWQLGKLGKNLRRHKISFGRSPGISELSPLSGKVGSVDSPSGSGDLGSVTDRMPPSQDSLPSLTDGKPGSMDVYSQSQPSCYTDSPFSDVNLLSVGPSDLKFHPNSVDREQDKEASTFEGPDPSSPAPSECTVDENLQNVNIFPIEEPEPLLQEHRYTPYPENSIDPNSSTPYRSSYQEQSLFSPAADTGCLYEIEVNPPTNQGTSILSYHYENSEQTENTVLTNQSALLVDTDISQNIAETFIRSYSNKKLPIDATMPGEFDHNSTNEQSTQSIVSSSESSAVKPWLSQDQSVRYLELHSASTLPSDVQNTQEHSQTERSSSQSLVTLYSGCHTEGKLQTSFPSSNKATTSKNHQCANQLPSITYVENSNVQTYSVSKINENETVYELRTVEECEPSKQNGILHAAKRMFSELQDPGMTGDPQDNDCLAQKSAESMPYLHKKFHHDQDRKVGLVSSQSADVSRYIHSYQSLLVNRLNGTLSQNIQFPSSICDNKESSKKQESSTPSQAQVTAPKPSQFKEYLCEVCGEASTGRSAYKTHYKAHEIKGQKNFTCRYCEEKFFRKCTKDLHEIRHISKCGYRCEQCSKVFSKDYKLQRHKQEVHATKKSFTCPKCSRGFSTDRRLQEHLQVHQSEKKHKCSHCNHSCYTATGLRTHVLERHSAGNYKHVCDVCGESFAKKYGLSRHMKRKHEVQQLSCQLCPKKFSCNEDLFQHIKCHNNDKSIKCNACEKTFTNAWGLQRHVQSHRPNCQFKCKKCSLQFTRKDSLKMHMRIHTQKRLHTCHCGKKFMRKSHLKEHKDSHSEVPRYSCQTCHRAFKFKGSLRNHSCSKSGERESVPDSREPHINEGTTDIDKDTGSSQDYAERE